MSDVEIVLATARQHFGRVVWTHKTQEKQREIWAGRANWIQWANILFAGATTGLAITAATGRPLMAETIISAVFAVCLAVGQAAYDPRSRGESHRVAAKELVRLRDGFLVLIALCLVNQPPDDLVPRLHALVAELHAVSRFMPDTSPKAYKAAEKAIMFGQTSFSDDEIDRLLPAELRKNGRPKPEDGGV